MVKNCIKKQILALKNPIFDTDKCGIYTDDGLAIIKEKGRRRSAERFIKPKLSKIFSEEDLKITIDR